MWLLRKGAREIGGSPLGFPFKTNTKGAPSKQDTPSTCRAQLIFRPCTPLAARRPAWLLPLSITGNCTSHPRDANCNVFRFFEATFLLLLRFLFPLRCRCKNLRKNLRGPPKPLLGSPQSKSKLSHIILGRWSFRALKYLD